MPKIFQVIDSKKMSIKNITEPQMNKFRVSNWQLEQSTFVSFRVSIISLLKFLHCHHGVPSHIHSHKLLQPDSPAWCYSISVASMVTRKDSKDEENGSWM